MRVAAFQEDLHLFGCNVFVVHDGFQITLYAAYGGFQLVGDVLGQLPFQPYLLFFLGDVVDGNFKAEVLEDDALHDEGASVLVDVYGHPSFFVVGGALLRLVDEICYLLEFADGEYLFGSLQVGV